jgi:hypothetical protein
VVVKVDEQGWLGGLLAPALHGQTKGHRNRLLASHKAGPLPPPSKRHKHKDVVAARGLAEDEHLGLHEDQEKREKERRERDSKDRGSREKALTSKNALHTWVSTRLLFVTMRMPHTEGQHQNGEREEKEGVNAATWHASTASKDEAEGEGHEAK